MPVFWSTAGPQLERSCDSVPSVVRAALPPMQFIWSRLETLVCETDLERPHLVDANQSAMVRSHFNAFFRALEGHVSGKIHLSNFASLRTMRSFEESIKQATHRGQGMKPWLKKIRHRE